MFRFIKSIIIQIKIFLLFIKLRFFTDVPKPIKRKHTLLQNVPNLHYNPVHCNSTKLFKPIKQKTPCIFAKSSLIWGAPDYEKDKSLKQNIEGCVPALQNFVAQIQQGDPLDGFVIAIEQDFVDEVDFGKAVKIALETLSKETSLIYDCMKCHVMESTNWKYTLFDSEPFFVTTFSPFYGSFHPRNSAGVRGCSFILLQPLVSFDRHKLPPYTSTTNKITPNIRDKCRINFEERGQPIHIPDKISFPMVHHIVRPINEVGSRVVAWWKD